ncbi:MAG: hypothetical protein LBI94_03955, partial [Treponema sp.]|nr:hypothetical protein [Treponema sp.]
RFFAIWQRAKRRPPAILLLQNFSMEKTPVTDFYMLELFDNLSLLNKFLKKLQKALAFCETCSTTETRQGSIKRLLN